MDALTLIKQNMDIDRLLEYYHFEGIHTDGGDIIRACCKLHEGETPTAFAINRETGLYYCHTNCGGGDVVTLIRKLEKIGFEDAVLWLSSFFGVNIDGLLIIEEKIKYLEELKKFIKVAKKRKAQQFTPYFIDEEIRPVTKYRDFLPSTLLHFQLGWVNMVTLKKKSGENYSLNNRLIFPLIFSHTQIGISFRRVKSTDLPKWSHQPQGINTGDILYNYDSITDTTQYVVICEGITDVWAYHEIGITAVATFGAHLTKEQYRLLMRTGADLVLSYDGDDAGRVITTKALATFMYKANLSVVHFNEGEDPASISREELKERFDSRKRY